VVRRHELTDEQWQVIESLLPPSGAKGRPRIDDRRVINGMLYKAKTGIAWRDLPERYGPWKTVYNRFWRWSRNGTLTELVKRARVIAEAIDELDREVAIDSSIVRAHQHAAGAPPPGQPPGRPRVSRGGPTNPLPTNPIPARPSQMITLSGGPVAGPPPRSTWPATDMVGHWWCY
jgi:transposase